MELLCPVCAGALTREQNTCRCKSNHSFDVARQGYVNLLTVQQKHSLHPGDTKEQVLARRRFLDAGFYAPIANALCQTAKEFGCQGAVLDAGCGEGYYSNQLQKALDADLLGLDVSKEAVRVAAGKYKNCQFVCGTAAHLPVKDHSIDLLTSLFAVTLPEEFSRVLKKDGIFIQVLAAKDHLMGLKSIIYPSLTDKEKDSTPDLPGFSLVKSEKLSFSFTVAGEQIMDLLSMTPHIYRISKDGLARLQATSTLKDTANCVINVYRPLQSGK